MAGDQEEHEYNASDGDTGGISRRKMLIASGTVVAGATWIAPSVLSLSSEAAVASPGAPVVVDLKKDASWTSAASRCGISGKTGCNTGLCDQPSRGSISFTYDPAANQICMSVSYAQGTPISTRQIFLLQANASGCLVSSNNCGTNSGQNPFTCCQTVVAGATQFAYTDAASVGGGNDHYTSFSVCLSGTTITACP